MNKRQRKKKAYSFLIYISHKRRKEFRKSIKAIASNVIRSAIVEYLNTNEFKQKEFDFMFGSVESKPVGWYNIDPNEWDDYVKENERIKIP